MNRGDMTYTAGTKKDNQDVQEQGQELGSAPRDSFFFGTAQAAAGFVLTRCIEQR